MIITGSRIAFKTNDKRKRMANEKKSECEIQQMPALYTHSDNNNASKSLAQWMCVIHMTYIHIDNNKVFFYAIAYIVVYEIFRKSQITHRESENT